MPEEETRQPGAEGAEGDEQPVVKRKKRAKQILRSTYFEVFNPCKDCALEMYQDPKDPGRFNAQTEFTPILPGRQTPPLELKTPQDVGFECNPIHLIRQLMGPLWGEEYVKQFCEGYGRMIRIDPSRASGIPWPGDARPYREVDLWYEMDRLGWLEFQKGYETLKEEKRAEWEALAPKRRYILVNNHTTVGRLVEEKEEEFLEKAAYLQIGFRKYDSGERLRYERKHFAVAHAVIFAKGGEYFIREEAGPAEVERLTVLNYMEEETPYMPSKEKRLRPGTEYPLLPGRTMLVLGTTALRFGVGGES